MHHLAAQSLLIRNVLRPRHRRHRRLMRKTLLLFVKRSKHVKNLLPILNRHNTPRRETLPISTLRHAIKNRKRRIPRSQKIGMQRMTAPFLHSPSRRNQRLRDNLSAKNTIPSLIRIQTPIKIDVYLLQIKKL